MPGNTASRRVMEKLGMTYEGTRDYYGHEQVRYALSSDAYAAWRPQCAGATEPPATERRD